MGLKSGQLIVTLKKSLWISGAHVTPGEYKKKTNSAAGVALSCIIQPLRASTLSCSARLGTRDWSVTLKKCLCQKTLTTGVHWNYSTQSPLISIFLSLQFLCNRASIHYSKCIQKLQAKIKSRYTARLSSVLILIQNATGPYFSPECRPRCAISSLQ